MHFQIEMYEETLELAKLAVLDATIGGVGACSNYAVLLGVMVVDLDLSLKVKDTAMLLGLSE